MGCGGGGGDSAPQTKQDNIKPVANAGPDQHIDEQSLYQLAGSGADSDGDIKSYQWQQVSGSEVQLLNANQPTANFTAPTVSVISGSQTLTFELSVTDNQGAITVDSVDITVIPVMLISDIPFDDQNLATCVNAAATQNQW